MSSRDFAPTELQSIYRQCFPEREWEQVPVAVRLAHKPDAERHGTFCIVHGRGFIARCLARTLRLPGAAQSVCGSVKILARPNREEWKRKFDGVPFNTQQWRDARGFVVERWRMIELRFRLVACQEGLRYEQAGAALRLGPLRAPIPWWIAPRVSAVESAVGPDEIRVNVRVSLPMLGTLIAYDGRVEVAP